MTELEGLINKISGHRGKRDYEALYYVMLSASNQKRENIKIKDLCTEAAVHLKIKPQSVAKAVSRAVVDIWDYGDRMLLSTLYGHDISVKPSPKDLILILHQHTN